MEGKNRRRLIIVLLLVLCGMGASAQSRKSQTDSLVRLMKARSLEQIDRFGINYRKAIDATFLHNGTYLICDTALWNVDMRVIHADGNVQVIQDETKLTSDKLTYFIDDNLAQFRGTLVQLPNKQKNILRTRHLDYNTRDSLAVFKEGGAMRDEDGQVIESWEGTYDSRLKEFSFRNNVNMFTDSVFVKTESLTYESDASRAVFNARIDFWKGGNMLSANKGWYRRDAETFFFTDDVHGIGEEQEAWSDSLYYYRRPNDVLLLGRAQIQDTTRKVAALADYIYYSDSLSKVTLCRRAAVALQTEEKGRVDTVYFGADTLIYRTIPRCDIPEELVKTAQNRLAEMYVDPVAEYRKKAAQEAAQAKEAALAESMKGRNPARPRNQEGGSPSREETSPEKAVQEDAMPRDSLSAPRDSLSTRLDSLMTPRDSLQMLADSLARRDTTKIGFAEAIRHVKIYRRDLQACCDSMTYSDLDSIARFYLDPVIWNDGNRQYTADSVLVLVKNSGMDRASLQSNAFIITQENEFYFDQIKGAEVMAYFDTTSALTRFDALGGVNALFYLKENNELATANQVECKMLSAEMKGGELQRNTYFGHTHNNATPLAQMSEADKLMKGFKWRSAEQPKGRWDITTLTLRPSERSAYMRRPRATFHQTDLYFPGYMSRIYRELAIRDSLARIPRPASSRPDTLLAPADSLSAAPDSLALERGAKDVAVADSLAVASDSPGVSADSTAVKAELPLSEKELRAIRREEFRKLKTAERDARWARLDSLDKARQEAREEKALARKRAKTLRLVRFREKQKAREAAILQRFIEKYRKRKAREERRQVPEARERVLDADAPEAMQEAPASS